MRYLNLGCGNRFHPDWINIDIASRGPGIIAHDLSRGIPLPDASCDVVYHSDLLEHLRRADVLPFMRECYRVLKPGGILRVVVPDLERICRLYLEKLEAVLNGNVASAYDYEWILLEMYDQTVRERSGGGMLDYLRQAPLPNEAFIYERIGEEGRSIVNSLRQQPAGEPTLTNVSRRSWRSRARGLLLRVSGLPRAFQNRLLARWLGAGGLRALKIGRFRLSGEVHQWMYDRYSLTQLMLAAGFQEPIVQSASKSRIPNWANFNLDITPDGKVNKPDSLVMESIKPPEAKRHA